MGDTDWEQIDEMAGEWNDFFEEWLAGLTPQERAAVYDDIMSRMTIPFQFSPPQVGGWQTNPNAGRMGLPSVINPITAQDVAILAWGRVHDQDAIGTTDFDMKAFDQLMAQNQKINPGSPVSRWWNMALYGTGRRSEDVERQKSEEEAYSQANLDGFLLVTSLAGAGYGLVKNILAGKAAGFTIKEVVKQQVPRASGRAAARAAERGGPGAAATGGEAATRASTRLWRGIMGSPGTIRRKISYGVSLAGIGYSLNSRGTQAELYGEEGQPPPEEQDPTATTTPPTITVIDTDGTITGQPGAIVEIPTGEMPEGTTPGSTSTGASSLSPDLAALALELGVDPSLFEAAYSQDQWNPLIWGNVGVGVDRFPQGVGLNASAPPTQPVRRILPQGEAARGIRGEERYEGAQPQERSPFIRPGSEVYPMALEQWNGKTYLEHAYMAAQTFGVPLDIMYGLITAESGWNPNAVSADGDRVGLAQISLSEHPEVTREMAVNPRFALEWTAKGLADNYSQFNSWEAAIVAHRDPQAAFMLFEESAFSSDYIKQYLFTVASFASQSSLGDVQFGGPESFLMKAPTKGTGSGGGIKISPFQAPDPDAIKQFVRSAFSETFKRSEPTEDEFSTAVNDLTDLYRQAYDEDVKKIRGQESEAVDPEASYLEQLETSGEGQFRKERTEKRGMMEYMGQVAAILRSGV